jgi:hypothetical protein
LVQADKGCEGMMAAINAAYVALIGQAETLRPAEVRL